MKNPKQLSNPGLKKIGNQATDIITLLSNSAHYFLESVFIIQTAESCRLVVYLKGRRLTDKCYKTMKGARIAFTRLYRNYAYNDTVLPEWTHFYHPQKLWLKERLEAELVPEPEEID